MKVRYTEGAREHLRRIADYIRQDDAAAASRVIDRIQRAVERLELFPRSSRPGRRSGSYELVVPDLPYVVVYRVGREYVDVLGVFHAARHPSVRTRP